MSDEPSISKHRELALRQALFQGMIYNEAGEPVDVAFVGGVAHYAIPDLGFRRHVEAYKIDDIVLAEIKDQITAVQNQVVEQMLKMMGKDDLFTKAALDASIRNLEQGVRQGGAGEWQEMLQMMGFRVIVDVHGEVVEMRYPQGSGSEE